MVELSSTTTATLTRRRSPIDMFALVHYLPPDFPVTTLRQLSRMASAMLVLTGRVTMRGLSRWAGQGGSDRTVQRFFSTVIPWATRFWVFFRQPGYRTADGYRLAGAAVGVTNAGQHTSGLDRFFTRLSGK